MKEGAEQLVLKFNLTAYADYNLFFILFAGFILTVLIQSSSATIAIALTALHAQALSFPAAACVIIGSEAGTTIKFLISSLQGSPDKRMLAWGDFLFNVFTVIISFALLKWIIVFIQDIVGIKDPLIGLVFFQSFINFLAILIFLPFINLFSRWLKKMFHKEKPNPQAVFNKELPALPELAPAILYKASCSILQRVIDFHKKIYNTSGQANAPGFLPRIKSFSRIHGTTEKEYSRIKEAEGNILKYYMSLQTDDLTKADYEQVNHCLKAIRQCIHAAKSVHDIRHNLAAFNSSANDYLFLQYGALQQEWADFEITLQGLLQKENDQESKPMMQKAMNNAIDQFQMHTNDVKRSLTSRQLNEIEASTLLNVCQEVLSSKKAMLRATALLKLNVIGQDHDF